MHSIVCVVVLYLIFRCLTECTYCGPVLFSAASRGNIKSSFEYQKERKLREKEGGKINILKQEQKDLITSQPNMGPVNASTFTPA